MPVPCLWLGTSGLGTTSCFKIRHASVSNRHARQAGRPVGRQGSWQAAHQALGSLPLASLPLPLSLPPLPLIPPFRHLPSPSLSVCVYFPPACLPGVARQAGRRGRAAAPPPEQHGAELSSQPRPPVYLGVGREEEQGREGSGRKGGREARGREPGPGVARQAGRAGRTAAS